MPQLACGSHSRVRCSPHLFLSGHHANWGLLRRSPHGELRPFSMDGVPENRGQVQLHSKTLAPTASSQLQFRSVGSWFSTMPVMSAAIVVYSPYSRLTHTNQGVRISLVDAFSRLSFHRFHYYVIDRLCPCCLFLVFLPCVQSFSPTVSRRQTTNCYYNLL